MRAAPRGAVSWRAAAVVVLCVAALLAGCTVGPSDRPPVAVRGENMPPPPTAVPQLPPSIDELPEPEELATTIPFYDCTEDLTPVLIPPPAPGLRIECGDLSVPADPDQPQAGSVLLGVLRVGSADAAPTLPPLLVVGDSAGEPTARAAITMAGKASPELLGRYSLIGVDRRGAGEDFLDCARPSTRSALVDASYNGEAALTALLEQARLVVQDCQLNLDAGLGAYRTATTSSDIEVLRQELGVERLAAIGVGDGAAALAGWARAQPTHVGRLVLDGPPAPDADEPELSEGRAKSAEAAFDAFAVACKARPDCPLLPDPRAAVTSLLDVLRLQPLLAGDGTRLTAGAAIAALLTGLRDPDQWPVTAGALAAAVERDPEPLLGMLVLALGPRGTFDMTLATSCNDTRRRLAPGEIGGLAQQWKGTYPLFGETMAMHMLACAPWPTGGPAPVRNSAAGSPPILVLGTAADPRGPAEGARRTAESLASTQLLTWQGAGTGAYPRTPCVQRVVDAMLVNGSLPNAATLCPP
ncbi:alpha/beta hydrolase [Actinomycetes bacterium KLBMP 9759]